MLRVVSLAAAFGVAVAWPSLASEPQGIRTAAIDAAIESSADLAVPPQIPRPPRYETITVVIGGDVGLAGSDQSPSPDGAVRHGQRIPIADMSQGVAHLLSGDVVFANLETVVTDRADLAATERTFNFRAHPRAVGDLVAVGFNIFSTANNHAFDYGERGIAETVRHLADLKKLGLRGAPGTGMSRASALSPAEFAIRDAKVAVSAIGIGAGGAADGALRPAMASYSGARDLDDLGAAQRTARADLRILSVHFGQEMQIAPSPSDERRLRDAAERYGIDLVAGHHAHVAAGIQDIGGRLIFYGLGNLMHPGMQDMGRYGPCRDFGVIARVHFGRINNARFEVRAVEVFTLRDMHVGPRVRTGEDGARRIGVLNMLATGLDDARGAAKGVRFMPQADGSGLYCTAAAQANPDAIARQCRVAVASLEGLPTAVPSQTCGPVTAHRSVPIVAGEKNAATTKVVTTSAWRANFVSDR